ncbi:MAG TPA: ClpXP protease specificity-enhancing factor [Chromatiaceae bacterium]|nr:ClpXP protease specificity-enhancing factor [Chromatiaceae bacterium]
MTSNRPYLIRAIWQWISDNGMTPHLLVNADAEGVEIPRQFVEDGRIVLNVSASAVRDLDLGNDWISFGARFSGSPMSVLLPVSAVLGIYSKENGQGMLFPEDEEATSAEEDDGPEDTPPSGGRPSLKVVK